MCQLHHYSPYIWHTHPHCLRSYPSCEDILQIVHNPEIITSTLICSWGIWKISNTPHKKKHNLVENIKSLIQAQLDRIGITTDVRETADSPSKPLQPYFAPVINDVCEIIIKLTGLKITLVDWLKIEKIKIVDL